ncbi:MAG: peptidylprolyl isomerase [Limisphaerales bacterium]
MRHKFLEVCGCCLALALNAGATPSIITPPKNITVNNASDAAFSVVASNAATYQWQFQGNDISGATGASLSLTNVNTNQAGTYTVVAASTDKSSVSNSAVLTIVPGTIVQFAISGYPGGASNLTVQLFDHDKPATVENFIHYIQAGAYTNLFWSRCVPGFVLQGGDYGADDRTNGSLLAYSIYEEFTVNLNRSPELPWQVDNEFNVGPLIHNGFGTLAMAKAQGEPDSAANAFFFNLADNSSDLDNQSGGFTVFGRILSGSNVLAYFNGLSKLTNGIFDSGAAPFTDLPVNYSGPVQPGDSNLFFVDFSLITQAASDTNPPTATLTYPTNGGTTTNADLVLRGTASDDGGMARVICNLFDSFGYNQDAFGGNAVGTTNWSYDAGNLPPGVYYASIEAQDGAGNLSTNFEISFTVPRFPFNAVANGPGTITPPNLNGTNVAIGKDFKIKAAPAAGAQFVNWTSGTTAFLNPSETFVMANGLQLTANFVSNTIRGGIAFTGPLPNAKLTNATVTVQGKIAANVGSATVTCQFFTASGISVTGQIVTNGTGTWSLDPLTFNPGEYVVQAMALDSSGGSTVISEKFTVLSPLTIITNGPGTTSLAGGTYQEPGTKGTITAKPGKGSFFYEWSDGTSVYNNPTHAYTNSSGLTLMATFIEDALPNSISFTYPTSQVTTDRFMVTGNISGDVVDPKITCQLLSGNTTEDSMQAATINGTTWSWAVSNLNQGHYTAVAVVTDSSGHQSVASQAFTVNFYPAVAGNYYGLFLPTNYNINAETAGRLSLKVGQTGTFSSKTIFPSRTYNVSYSFGTSGEFAWEAGGFDGELYSGMEIDLTKGYEDVTGYVYSLGVYAELLGYRGVTSLSTTSSPAVGNYVFNLQTITNQQAGGPTNDGYATLAVATNGQLKLSGVLADNTTFSETVGVSQNGIWPVYAGLYGGSGMLIGWVTNQPSGTNSGTLYWIKPATRGAYYPSNMAIFASFTGTNYVAPVSGSQYQIVFSGNSISPPVTNDLNVVGGQFVPTTGTSDQLKISLSTTGVLSGKFLNPSTGKMLPFEGAFTSPSQGGTGFVLDTGHETGSLSITLLP